MSALNSSANAGVIHPVVRAIGGRPICPRLQLARMRLPVGGSTVRLQEPAAEMQAAAQQPTDLTQDASLLDIWSGIEDVWQRLSVLTVLDVIDGGEGEGTELLARDFRTVAVGIHQDLRRAATDADLYQGRYGGRLRTIVTLIEYRGDDLVLTFSPLRLISRWEDGNNVAAQIQAFMFRIASPADTKWRDWVYTPSLDQHVRLLSAA